MLKSPILVIGFFISLQALAAGGDVGNGGDGVFCRPSPANAFSGYYSLDYLVKFDPENPALAAQSLEDSLTRIENTLQDKLPGMVESFREYRKDLFNGTDFSRHHLWEKAPFGLIDLKDEALVNLLPENCLQDGKVRVVQAVIRQPPEKIGLPEDKINYKYVPQVVEELRRKGPVQLSFLLVHEWLWDFSKNVERNRKVNYWLHSTFLEKWTREEWLSNLNGIGFSVPETPEPVWNEAICETDAEHTKAVSEGISWGEALLGKGRAFKRIGVCDRKSGCSKKFKDVSFEFQKEFGPDFSIYLIKGGLETRSSTSGLYHFRCAVTPTGESGGCHWIPEAANGPGDVVELSPVIGRDCATFRGRKVTDFGSFSNIEEIVFYFSGLKFP